MSTKGSWMAVALAAAFGWPAQAAPGCGDALDLNQFDVYFPQVAQGMVGELRLETAVSLSNPDSGQADVCLELSGVDYSGPARFQLGPRQSFEAVFGGEALQRGFLRVVSNRALAASARILTRTAGDPGNILTIVNAPGRARTSKAAIPVLLGSPEGDETGVAIVYRQDGGYRFTLYDSAGLEIASRQEQRGFNPSGASGVQAAFLLTDLFPQLPGDFQSGLLLIEHVQPARIAQAFAATALYLRGGEFRSAEAVAMDDPREFGVFLREGQDREALAADLVAIYRAEETRLVGSSSVLALMTTEIARAVARDPRVQDVQPNNVGSLSGR